MRSANVGVWINVGVFCAYAEGKCRIMGECTHIMRVIRSSYLDMTTYNNLDDILPLFVNVH